jgi:alpha-beta hydrolase superfamily lysophospholipase
LARAGLSVYALDVRGHGDSGARGQIDYVGQLEDDLEDFVHAVLPAAPRCLCGFSAGGGFALRVAGSKRQQLFDGYLLLAPFLSQRASTYRARSGGWVSVGLPRMIGLLGLNAIGLSALNSLAVTAFALRPESRASLTPRYSYALAMNFRPHQRYRADMAAVRRPMHVLVGQHDDQFIAERFAAEFSAAGGTVPVKVVPQTGHLGLTLSVAGVQAIVDEVLALSGRAA